MGKGDQRSRRGKIWRGTFGKRRPRKSKTAGAVRTAAPVVEKKGRARKEAETSE
jgi:30S ribosomal protein S31